MYSLRPVFIHLFIFKRGLGDKNVMEGYFCRMPTFFGISILKEWVHRRESVTAINQTGSKPKQLIVCVSWCSIQRGIQFFKSEPRNLLLLHWHHCQGWCNVTSDRSQHDRVYQPSGPFDPPPLSPDHGTPKSQKIQHTEIMFHWTDGKKNAFGTPNAEQTAESIYFLISIHGTV